MAVEKRRGCGFRKVGGVYLCCDGFSFSCDRLPFPVSTCPTCGAGIKSSRGFGWIDVKAILGGEHRVRLTELNPARVEGPCDDPDVLCRDPPEKAGMLWVGSKFYTPSSFIQEAKEMGISKRISHIPRGLELGKTWILLGHRAACHDSEKNKKVPGIFYMFRPNRIEKIVADTTGQDELDELKKKGITPVVVPANDPDHRGSVYDDFRQRKLEVSESD